MENSHPICNSIWFEKMLDICKTGDLILFKSQDNINSSKMISYFTHIGVVFNQEGKKYLFEAQYPDNLVLKPHESRNGIYISPLETRLSRYKGLLYFKQLNKEVPEYIQKDFCNFINYAQKNMFYETNIMLNAFKKLLGEKVGTRTNCGELTMLSLIKLGILDETAYNTRHCHHLRWMSSVVKCKNDYHYFPIQKINISPFS